MPPKIINTVNRILRAQFNFHTPLKNMGNGTWSLNEEYSSGETIDNKGFRYTLWPFPVKPELIKVAILHPLHFSFNIKLKVNENISEVNIKIFKEDIFKVKDSTTIPTELMLRVEWSNEPPLTGAKHIHAQPHWHVHSYKFVDFSSEFPSYDTKTILEVLEMDNAKSQSISIMDDAMEEIKDEGDNQTSNDIPPFKFHLSMLSDWHLQKNSPHNNILTEVILENWLPQCLYYIKGQIDYIYERM